MTKPDRTKNTATALTERFNMYGQRVEKGEFERCPTTTATAAPKRIASSTTEPAGVSGCRRKTLPAGSTLRFNASTCSADGIENNETSTETIYCFGNYAAL